MILAANMSRSRSTVMKNSCEFIKPNPQLSANFISRSFYWWLKDLLMYGSKHDLAASDVYEVLPQHESKRLCDDFEKVWNAELKNAERSNRKPSLWKACIKNYRSLFFKLSTIPACCTIISLILPLVLHQFLLNFGSSLSYAYITMLVLLQIGQTVGLRHSFIELHLVGMRAKVALTSLMYRKIMQLSCSSENSSVGGTVVNLMTNDVQRFEPVTFYIPYFVLAPIELIVITYILWRYIGYAAFMAVISMILQTFPLQAFFYRLTSKYRPQQSVLTDKRISLIGEVINGIRTIKMFSWESFFEKLVYFCRRCEIRVYRKINNIVGLTSAIGGFGYRLTIFLTILVYAFQYSEVSPFSILLIVQYMINMRQTLLVYFALGVRYMANAATSMKRVEDFLLLDEIKSNVKMMKMDDTNIQLNKVIVSRKSDTAVQKSLHFNVNFTSKRLHVIVGPVGAGKSTLLGIILDEIQPDSGEVFVSGKISYSSQEPWLFGGSIKENIIFGEKYDEEKYKRVTETCALVDDFQQLPHGDGSPVGERGSNLSGGQCARVNLARAVYRDADIYLLDDPTSAVDSQVANKIFENCINGYLKNKTRILVTNNFQYLNQADEIIFLDDGKIEFKGTFADFKENEKYCLDLPVNRDSKNSTVKNVENMCDSERLNVNSLNSRNMETNEDKEPKETEELLAKGYVKRSVYLRFIREAGSNITLFFVILAFLIAMCSTSALDYWQVAWANSKKQSFKDLNNTNIVRNASIAESSSLADFSYVETSLFICGGLMVVIIITSIAKSWLFFKVVINACERLHNKMFESLMRTPLNFFQANSAGRILNRFSKDTGTTDEMLAYTLFTGLNETSNNIVLLVPVLIVNWWYTIPSLIIIYLCCKLSQFFLPTIQAIKRIEANAKSPVLSLAVSSFSGLSIIRAAKSEHFVRQAFDRHQNHHTAAHFLTTVTNMSLAIWLDITVFLLWFIVAYSSIFFKNSNVFVAEVGLALVQLRSIAMIMQYSVRQFAESIYQMTSIERMLQFVDLQHEPDAEIEVPVKPNKNWPNRGEVIFDKLYLRYSEDAKPVLKNLSFVIESGMKVGIAGRTGAGKSSLISALFRFAKFEGSLLIDGIDIKKISYSDLRNRISVIPQEPMLFAASLRDNLDLKHEVDDASLWSALENVELNKSFDSLDFVIDKGGSNLSAGQRQLLCLARTIVKRNKILILDEATANVDFATDALIQKTIRTVFKDCTLLTIAHRLNTIMDSDKVLVLDYGEVVEFDHPHILLERNDGYFFNMVQQTGQATSQHLKTIAEQAFKKKWVIDEKYPTEEK